MKTIGIAEFNNIPEGLKNLDMVLKKANVTIYKAGVTCPGKYYFIVYGENEDVKSAFQEVAGEIKMCIRDRYRESQEHEFNSDLFNFTATKLIRDIDISRSRIPEFVKDGIVAVSYTHLHVQN